jgi:hypothetical protein
MCSIEHTVWKISIFRGEESKIAKFAVSLAYEQQLEQYCCNGMLMCQ